MLAAMTPTGRLTGVAVDMTWRGRSKRLSHMHVLGLEFIELRQWLGHELVAATHVEAHRVLRRCGGDDNLGITGVPGDQVQIVGQATADARCADLGADMEERELRDLRAKVSH